MHTLDELAIKHGTDKSSKFHHYTRLYEQYFENMRNDPIHLLELGFGGHEDPELGGESAAMWREYFPNAIISIVDISPKNHIPEGVNFYCGSQDNPILMNHIASEHGAFDIIIDDASHVSSLSIKSWEILYPLLKPGGIYVLEDTHSSYHDFFYGNKEANENPEKNGRFGQITAMNYFKRMIDEVNNGLFPERYSKGFQLEWLTFYYNILFAKKI